MNELAYVGACEESGIQAEEFAKAGWDCYCIDLLGETRFERGIHFIKADFRYWMPPRRLRIGFFAGFPPCTNLAVSGSRWMREKGIRGLIQALDVFDACVRFAESCEAPYYIENPVSTISTYYRKPDYTFHPYEYGDPWLKKTCLWTGGGFVMPPKAPVEPIEGQKIWRMPPSEDRAILRSKTPAGFAKAVFQANCKKERVA